MKTQWENFLQNLGEWQGSFTQFSPNGELLNDIPSHLTLESFNADQTVRLTLRRFYPSSDGSAEPEVKELVREYQSLGRDILFFENGAFSQGTIQLSPFSQSGGEFGFISENRRLRLVQLYNSDGVLNTITLIREKRQGTDTIENPPLTVEALLGEWQGEAITIYPDLRSPDIFPTRLTVKLESPEKLVQTLSFGQVTFNSAAEIKGSILNFNRGEDSIKVLLLPDGASATIPSQVELRKPFFFEAGWLVNPEQRQRLIRRYNNKGEWSSLTLVTESKVNSLSKN